MAATTATMLGASALAGASIYSAKKQKKEAKKRESEIRKANEQAVAEAKSLQQKSEDQARARIAAASADQELSNIIFLILVSGLRGSSLKKKLLGQ